MTHQHFMALALAAAREAGERGEVPVGAVLVHQGEVVATSGNSRETTPDPTGHAELNVLRAAAATLGRWRLTGCTLYVTLEPCPMCAPAIAQARVDRLVFGAMDPKQGAAGTVFHLLNRPEFNHRVELIAGICEAACTELLEDFFRQRRTFDAPGQT